MITRFANLAAAAAATLFLCASSNAQFGGGPGDVVIYAVTYNGSGTLQALPPSTTNSAQANAAFKTVPLASVPVVGSDPFPLARRVFYMTNSETFQVGTDVENTIGLWRLFVFPVKIFQIQGITNAVGPIVGRAPAFIYFPKGLDVVGDIADETLVVITWFPGPWPFILVTDRAGPLRPPTESGFQYLFTTPGLVTLPSLLPWTPLPSQYPGAGWKEKTFTKLIEIDNSIGDTIQLLRLQPGTQTPIYKTAGHTHLFVLQGSVNITPAGGSTVHMNTQDYAYLPEGFAISLSNPAQFSGPTGK